MFSTIFKRKNGDGYASLKVIGIGAGSRQGKGKIVPGRCFCRPADDIVVLPIGAWCFHRQVGYLKCIYPNAVRHSYGHLARYDLVLWKGIGYTGNERNEVSLVVGQQLDFVFDLRKQAVAKQ